jgi:transposase
LSRPDIRLPTLRTLNVLKLYKTKMGQMKSTSSKNRIFSTSLKESIVKDIESKRTSVQDVVTLYAVSATSVYKWLAKYSQTYPRSTRMVVEQESEAVKTRQLMADKAELQRALGEKQMELDLLNKLIGVASEQLQVDIKKTFFEKWSSGIV